MQSEDLFAEAKRQLTVCNACRYCEGYCAVFPALELRSDLKTVDLTHLAHLCHECGACQRACMYETPHVFAVDIPVLMRSVRHATYAQDASPRWVAASLWRHPFRGMVLAFLAAALLVAGASVGLRGMGNLLRPHQEAGGFYAVLPWAAMVISAIGLSVFAATMMGLALARSWRAQADPRIGAGNIGAWIRAAQDALVLRNLQGGGPGCPRPDTNEPSRLRRWCHHLVLYGFAADFASTVSAAFLQDTLGWLPPYPYVSVPVVLGTLGGVAIILGCCGLLYLKFAAWIRNEIKPDLRALSFTVALACVAITGIALLAGRATGAMGVLLVIHLATVFALFLTLPYGQFVHSWYHLAALVGNRLEMGEPR